MQECTSFPTVMQVAGAAWCGGCGRGEGNVHGATCDYVGLVTFGPPRLRADGPPVLRRTPERRRRVRRQIPLPLAATLAPPATVLRVKIGRHKVEHWLLSGAKATLCGVAIGHQLQCVGGAKVCARCFAAWWRTTEGEAS